MTSATRREEYKVKLQNGLEATLYDPKLPPPDAPLTMDGRVTAKYPNSRILAVKVQDETVCLVYLDFTVQEILKLVDRGLNLVPNSHPDPNALLPIFTHADMIVYNGSIHWLGRTGHLILRALQNRLEPSVYVLAASDPEPKRGAPDG